MSWFVWPRQLIWFIFCTNVEKRNRKLVHLIAGRQQATLEPLCTWQRWRPAASCGASARESPNQGIWLFHSTQHLLGHTWKSVQLSSPNSQDIWKKIERVQWRATKIVTELENLTYKEILMELNLFYLEDRRFRGKLITFHQYLKYIYKKHGGALFTRKHGDKTMGTSWFWRSFFWI